MKITPFVLLCTFSAACATLCAQTQKPSTFSEKQVSSLLLSGIVPLGSSGQPMKKTKLIPKIEIVGLFQKRISMGVEFPINDNRSIILTASRMVLNATEPQKVPGIYSHSYTRIDIETTAFFLLFTTRESTTSSPPYNKWGGNFLPVVDYSIQPKIRSYLGKKQSGNRFYWEPGLAVHLLSGFANQDSRIVLSSSKTTESVDFIDTITTETNTFQETRTVTSGEKKATIGITLGFGFQAQAGKHFVFDLNLETAATATEHWRGMKRATILPQIQVGYRI